MHDNTGEILRVSITITDSYTTDKNTNGPRLFGTPHLRKGVHERGAERTRAGPNIYPHGTILQQLNSLRHLTPVSREE